MPEAKIGVFGGTGFYELLADAVHVKMDTPFGPPSGRLSVGKVEGVSVAFMPRHGRDHSIPPHAINYRANLWAMREAGVERIVAPCAAGSLQAEVKPGDFVICDQLVDRTTGRVDTFYDGPVVTHVSMADPYCPEMRSILIRAGRELGLRVHDKGTVVVIQGPRFSTRAESRWFSSLGWEVINMTQYPEAVLARELGICYANVSLITDYDAGLEGHPEVKAVTHEEVVRVFQENNEKLKSLIFAAVKAMPTDRGCGCEDSLRKGRMQ